MQEQKSNNKIPLNYIFHFIQFALIIVLIIQMGFLLNRLPDGPGKGNPKQARRPEPKELDVDMDELTQNSHTLGNENAKVTIVKFNSFSCGYCNRARKTIMRLYNENKKNVRIVYKHFNRGMKDMESAVAAECAGEQGKFWDMYHNIFEYSRQMGMDDVAKKTGLNMVSFKKCTASGKFESKITANSERGNQLGIRGTPSFVINGKLIVGALPYEQMKKIIEDEL